MSETTRIALRWMAAGSLTQAFLGGLVALGRGDKASLEQAIAGIYAALEVEDLQPTGDWGSASHRINADWLGALGPRQHAQVRDLVRDLARIRKDLRSSFPVRVDSIKQRITGNLPVIKLVERFSVGSKVTFQHGLFTVVTMSGVPVKEAQEALVSLDSAAKLIAKHFPQVLYGKIFVSNRTSRGEAQYVATTDNLFLGLSAKQGVGEIHAICHELGHRYAHRFWNDPDQRAAFRHLSTEPLYRADEYSLAERHNMAEWFVDAARKVRAGEPTPVPPNDRFRQWLDFLSAENGYKFRTLGRAAVEDPGKEQALYEFLVWDTGPNPVKVLTKEVLRGPIYVTPYGRKNWGENFAEAFAFYVMGRPLPPEIAEIMQILR